MIHKKQTLLLPFCKPYIDVVLGMHRYAMYVGAFFINLSDYEENQPIYNDILPTYKKTFFQSVYYGEFYN